MCFVRPSEFQSSLLNASSGPRITLFAYGETCRFSIFDRGPADDLRRTTAVACWHRDWRDATVPSSLDVDLVDGFVCLFRNNRSLGWIQSQNLAVAQLGSGKMRNLGEGKFVEGGFASAGLRRGKVELA